MMNLRRHGFRILTLEGPSGNLRDMAANDIRFSSDSNGRVRLDARACVVSSRLAGRRDGWGVDSDPIRETTPVASEVQVLDANPGNVAHATFRASWPVAASAFAKKPLAAHVADSMITSSMTTSITTHVDTT